MPGAQRVLGVQGNKRVLEMKNKIIICSALKSDALAESFARAILDSIQQNRRLYLKSKHFDYFIVDEAFTSKCFKDCGYHHDFNHFIKNDGNRVLQLVCDSILTKQGNLVDTLFCSFYLATRKDKKPDFVLRLSNPRLAYELFLRRANSFFVENSNSYDVKTFIHDLKVKDKLPEPKPKIEPQTYTTKDVCNMLNVTICSVTNWITSGKLKASKIKNKWMISVDDFERFLSSHKIKRNLKRAC